ncbi:lysophospholipid acyltransferase family protein [Nevskia sp.]|uniref:lysophospholipid acyltransferase family protein n=1 Tax=Nevskia sp. TaxID=1929292 RepID=UPI0025D13674|nr:lysophospholipid acyltransferase family protein [Nevskia sp.]
MLTTLLRKLHGAYAAAIFVVVVLMLFCPLLIVAPTLPMRRAIGRTAVRAWLLLSAIPFRVRGREQLPAEPVVVICNHASYLDGILLTAALPARFTFLVQHGAGEWPYIGLVLRRMGVCFVNRGSTREAAKATKELIDRIKAGESFAIFPEGTFRAAPLLLPFQSGAFLIAARAGVPVVPAVLTGTRRLLGEGRRLFTWSPVVIRFFEPLRASDESRAAADTLSAVSRAVILAHCGEGDGTSVPPAIHERA